MMVSLHVQYVGHIGLPQYKIVVHASQPRLVYRSHTIRSPKNSQEAILARTGAARKTGGRRKGHVQYVGHIGHVLMVSFLRMPLTI